MVTKRRACGRMSKNEMYYIKTNAKNNKRLNRTETGASGNKTHKKLNKVAKSPTHCEKKALKINT